MAIDREAWFARIAKRLTEGPLSEACVLALDGHEAISLRCVVDRNVSGKAMSGLPRGSSPRLGTLTDEQGCVWDARPRLPVREAEQARRLGAAHVAASRLPEGLDVEIEAGVAVFVLMAGQKPTMRR